MGNNGLALAAGLLNGIGQGMQTAQDRAIKQEYQKVMMDQHKLQGKMLEAKMKEMDLKSSIQPQLISFLSGLDSGGAPGPGAPNIAPAATPEGFTANPVPSSGGLGITVPQGRENIAGLVEQVALAQGVDPNLAKSIARFESNFNPNATSPKGAAGVMQLMPGTAQGLGVTNPYDPHQNISGGVAYLKQLQDKFGNRPDLIAAGYNAGPGAVDKYGGVPPYKETQAFVQNVTGALPQMLAAEQTRQQINSPKSPSDRLSITKMPIGKRVALDLMFKQMFDLDTKFRENKTTIKTKDDGGYDVFDSDGNLIKTIPGPGKTQLIPVKDATGATSMQPVSVFPGGQIKMGGPGLSTGPAPIKWDEIEEPGGQKRKIAVPEVPQLGMEYQTAPSGVKIADAGRVNMIMQANNRMDEVNKMLMGGGKINRGLIGQTTWPLSKIGGVGEGAQLYSKMYQTVDSALRLETGAQANEQEIQTKMNEYWPSFKDTDATIRQKMKDLNEYVKGVVELNDPTGELRKMRGGKGTAPATGTKPTYRFNPATGKLEAAQ